MHACVEFPHIFMCRFRSTYCVWLSLVAPAYASLYYLKRMNIHENQQPSKLAYENDDGNNDYSVWWGGGWYESCIIIIIMANEMKSGYSLNSFKLFIVVWALCLTIPKIPVKSFILSHPFCIHKCCDVMVVMMRVVSDDCRFNLVWFFTLHVNSLRIIT